MGLMAHRAMRAEDEVALIAHEWCVEMFATPDSKVFDGDITEKRFTNPNAYHIAQTSNDVVEYLFSKERNQEVPDSIDDLCKLVALQEKKPSEAFSSFFKLRKIVLSHTRKGDYDAKALIELDERIDAVFLRAMDSYTRCREQVMQLRIDELNRSRGAFQDRYAARAQVGV